ncbi:MAG: octaprenyl diphosphate synthase [Nitrosomonas sp.]|nr:octaprenyl diphosphate synthase [Nitrosomonas sp.]
MSIEHIRRFIAQDMGVVDEVIRQKLHSHVALIRQVSEYIISSGGKRLRPALVVLSAGSFGYAGQHHYNLAAVVEFIHTATLLHDDVVDESEMRRNKETANALFGNAASVLVGDFLYSRAFQMMVEVDNMRVMQVLADATNTIAEGEVLQLLNCRDPDVNEENYLRVIRFKTAKLFEAASRLGAILGGAIPEHERAMTVYGMHLGTAFQLIDDLLDYSGDHQDTGKNLGDDLAEGKPTLPLIHAIRTGNAEQAGLIREAIKNGGIDDLKPVLEIIHTTGALDYTKKCALHEIEIALSAIAPLPDSEYKNCLIQLADFSVTRNY